MLSKVTVALAFVVTIIAMSVPASANPKPTDGPYSSGYQDMANNKNGW